jgi:3-dehydroquinate dehydratase type I
MQQQAISFTHGNAQVVGSFGSLHDLTLCTAQEADRACDLLEIRLDVLLRDGWQCGQTPWSHLRHKPILFTARCQEEGGVLPLDAQEREEMLDAILDDAAAVDVEISSVDSMPRIIAMLKQNAIPWVASCHRFDKLPDLDWWREQRQVAFDCGATVAKFAAMIHVREDIDLLESFQQESSPLCVATMGMGVLAPASRVRCALAGSVLNYGYIGAAPTAPGQWPAAELREAIRAGKVPAV